MPPARPLRCAPAMRASPFAAFALASLLPLAAGAQEAAVVTRVVDNAPVVVESAGRPQEVRLERFGPALCSTPCTLHVPPGHYTLWTGGRGVRVAEVPVQVGPEGARVRVRAASRARYVGGIITTALGGGTVALFGGVALAALLGPDDEYNRFFAGMMGGAALVVGVPTLIVGLVLLGGAETGVEEVGPVAPAAPRWTLGVAPLRDGASVGAAFTF